ncbi:MAG: ABC transporter substrate-binding protein [Acidobacteria bacterium]|nr:ABC transporter substrate-binding protein [Acidobacteriota bacterium]
MTPAQGASAGPSGSGETQNPGGGGALAPGGKVQGVTAEEITVAYYWNDRTRSSPYLHGAGAAGANLDEDQAFRAWIEYINRHRKGGATFMGFPFNLHGRRLKPVVVDVGSSADTQSAALNRIATEVKPFAAIAAHGSISTYFCPTLASKGIFNIATYDLDFDLYRKTSGWCLPAYASFNAQVDAMERYLSHRVAPSRYQGTSGPAPRRFGLLYAEYPGLADAMRTVVRRFERAGVRFAAKASVSADLATAAQQAGNVVGRFRNAGVNTVVIPDAGSPMSFTPTAQSQAYTPDYVVWPCSGQDQPAQVRLYNASQWARATGLTCYNREFMLDLTLDQEARETEWYARFKSVSSDEPPAQTPLIYSAILPLLVGVTGAGRDLSPASFRAGLSGFAPYRYGANVGRTSDGRGMLLSIEGDEHATLGDFTILRWSGTAQRKGSSFTGTYVFPEDGRRYGRRDAYR